MAEDIKRRDFLKSTAATAALAAPGLISAQGANNKVNIGWIGVGTRGNAGIDWLHSASPNDVNLVAVCDTFDGYIARAKDRVKTIWGNMPDTYKDYRQLLANKSIDAVYIMTPEHLHHDMAIAALKAGKHVYVEKPLAHTIEEGWDIIDAWKKSGKVCQVGTQNRSSSLYKQAKEWVQKGMIGDCHYVRAFWYRNSAADNPAWRYKIPPDANEQNSDWAKFLGPAPKRPFDLQRYYQWRLYWDYSGGISTDLLVHQTDITNFVMGKTLPYSCMASGGITRWTDANDDREVPDTLSAIYDYADKFHINYSCYFGNDQYGYGEQFCGNEGTIEVLNRQDLHYYPQLLKGAAPDRVKARKEVHLNGPKEFGEPDGLVSHIKNFIESVRGNEKPVAPVEAGQQAAISGHMATLSLKSGKKVIWDAKTEKVKYV
jgi:predicted dehydrogenase